MKSDPKFFRSNKVVARSALRRKRKIRRILFSVVFFSALVTGLGYLGYSYFIKSERFVPRQLIVNNVEFSDAEAIHTKVSEIIGDNMLTLDLSDICRATESFPWIRKAKANKVLPDTLMLEVTETVPIAFAVIDSVLYLVDDRGLIIDAARPEHPFKNLPIILGLDDRGEDERSLFLRQSVTVLNEIAATNQLWLQAIEDISVTGRNKVILNIENAVGPIILDPRNTLSCLGKYFLIERSIQERYHRAEYIDTRFLRRLVVKAME